MRGDDGGSIAQARALSGLAVLTRRSGDMAAAGDLQRRSLAIWRVVGDGRGVASSLNNLGALAALQGDFAQAEPLLLEAKALWRELGKEVNVASTLTNLAFLERERGDFEAAQAFCEESLLAGPCPRGPEGRCRSLSRFRRRSPPRGGSTRRRSRSTPRSLRRPPRWVMSRRSVMVWRSWGGSSLLQDTPEHAARLLGAGKALNDTVGFHEKSSAQTNMDHAIEDARRALPEAAFAAAWAEGQAMTAEQAAAYALEETPAALGH